MTPSPSLLAILVVLQGTLVLLPPSLLVDFKDMIMAIKTNEPYTKTNDQFSDNYVDEVLANLRERIITENLDPAELPNTETGFSDTILGITWHGSANLYNGLFSGLSTIGRTGDTSFTVDGSRVRLTAYVGIAAPGVSAHYDASAEFMGITVSASATAGISEISIYLDATKDLASKDLANLEKGLQIQEFHISHVGNIDVDISGLGPLGWILELVVDFINAFLKDWLIDLVEGPLKDLMQSVLDDVIPDFPTKLEMIMSEVHNLS